MIQSNQHTVKPGASRNMPVVGIRVPSWASFTRPIFRGIVDFIRNNEQWQIQTLVDSTNEMAPVLIDENWRGDGLILFRYSVEEAKIFKQCKIPVVNLSAECLGKGFPTVIPNNFEIGKQAAQHMLTLGLKNFSYWGDPSRNYSIERGEAFEQQIRSAGFDCIKVQIEPDHLPWDGRWVKMHERIVEELIRLPKPVGIFAKDDMLGSNIIRICNEVGILVPEEIAVMGTNADEVFCQISTPPLSSVAYPGESVGYEAARLLSTMMNGKSVKNDHLVTMPIRDIVARESTNTFAIDDLVVTQAVQYIRAVAPVYPIHVSEVAARSPLSLSGFNKHFVQQMGHTPKEEIKRVRLAKLQALLKNSNEKISQIARDMKFGSPEELSRFFKRETGMVPKEYRSRYQNINSL
ncbi:MAG: DNA-binding transcriptional regulator [Verrucomicrobiota bacterium]|nr:DNA-binding transcriptional regulator [Verrucomicrobiota bacterium]